MRIYRASELGGCTKAQAAKQLGFMPLETERFFGALGHEGNLHEDDVIKREGATDSQLEVTLDVMPSVQIVGHVDGLLDPYVVEVKSMGKAAFDMWMASKWDTAGLVQKYKWQVSVYMIALNRPLKFIVKCRDNGQLDTCFVEAPFYDDKAILRRVVEIERWVRRGELPDECSDGSGNTTRQFPCPFYYLEQQTTLEVTEDNVIDELARMYKDASLAVKVAETRKREARKALDQGLAGRERVVTALSKVTYYEVKTEKIDFNKMAEDGIDVNKYKVPTVGNRLRVTVKDDGIGDEFGGDRTREETDKGRVDNPEKVAASTNAVGEAS